MLAQLERQPGLPRTWENGQLVVTKFDNWTSGFFPGSLWYLFEGTGDTRWREAAERYTALVEPAKDLKRTHDLGFMLYCSFGNGLRLTNDPRYRAVLLTGAASLATRFNPTVGAIRSWDHGTWQYPVIIDNMMNLELLTWAANAGKEPRFRAIALAHADTTLRNHFRPDASSFHVVDYDVTTGKVRGRGTHQGFADDSSWARGQAWGLYGYTMMYRETKRPEYLAQAVRIADFFLNHPRLPADKIPYWDFDAPDIPRAPRDVSAAAITCSALLELARYVEPGPAATYKAAALEQLRAMSSPAYRAPLGGNGCFLLMHATGHKPKNSEIDVPLAYADYYFLEALLRAKALE
ncbi:glucuronyl hydrolase [Opitutus sp. ER46]|nr:glucuronyl hydrolase [Opitutus sp. ER46]